LHIRASLPLRLIPPLQLRLQPTHLSLEIWHPGNYLAAINLVEF